MKNRLKGLAHENVATQARKATGLSQKEFSVRYRIPLATLRNHEQGAVTANNLTTYYELIAEHPVLISNLIEKLPK